jgi:hypothetical protein
MRLVSQGDDVPHTIRLRGPWQHDVSRGRFTRSFHRPTGLTDSSRVSLVINPAIDLAAIWLNGQPLGQIEPKTRAELEITALLQPRNEIIVCLVAGTPTEGEIPFEVNLQIDDNSPAS